MSLTLKTCLRRMDEYIVSDLGRSKKTRDYCSSWEYVKRVIKYVDNILSEGIAKLNTPTPLGYELNNELKLI